jgi:hypothetical protein
MKNQNIGILEIENSYFYESKIILIHFFEY